MKFADECGATCAYEVGGECDAARMDYPTPSRRCERTRSPAHALVKRTYYRNEEYYMRVLGTQEQCVLEGATVLKIPKVYSRAARGT